MSTENISGSYSQKSSMGQDIAELAGKYLTFELAGEQYGLEILKVREIIGMMNVTRVPGTADFIRGVINLRGQVITVVDLRARFNIQSVENTEKTCIIVVQLKRDAQQLTLGIIVDQVCEVVDVTEDQIAPAPSFGQGIENDFILGMGKMGQTVLTILDINKVLSDRDVGLSEDLPDNGGDQQAVSGSH